MNAISLLKSDHKKVGELFKQIGELSDTAHATRGKLFAEIDRELTVHSKIEEEYFYPAVKEKARLNSPPGDEVREAYEEQDNIKAMVAKLHDLNPTDDTYNAKLQVLGELVKHHVKEEETELFVQARELLAESELKSLGEQMEAMKEQLLAVEPALR